MGEGEQGEERRETDKRENERSAPKKKGFGRIGFYNACLYLKKIKKGKIFLCKYSDIKINKFFRFRF